MREIYRKILPHHVTLVDLEPIGDPGPPKKKV